MSDISPSPAMRIAEQLARGEIALTLLAQLGEHVADFDYDKGEADKIYQGKIQDCTYALVSRMQVSVRRAQAALETIGTADDEIDDDD